MIEKSDSLSRLIERTSEHANIVQPMIRPMFSHSATTRNNAFTQPMDLTMINESIDEPGWRADSPLTAAPSTPVHKTDASHIDSPPPSPFWNRDTDARPMQQAEPDSGQEHMSNTSEYTKIPYIDSPPPSHSGRIKYTDTRPMQQEEPDPLPLWQSEITERSVGCHMPPDPSTGSERDQLSIDVTKSSEPINIKLLFLGTENNVSRGVHPQPRSSRLSEEAAEYFSLLTDPSHGDPDISLREPLERSRQFRTRFYVGKECKTKDESTTSVVQVTIGRIDVSAIMRQPPVQAPVVVPDPVKPVLSLNEYLQQRDRGKR